MPIFHRLAHILPILCSWLAIPRVCSLPLLAWLMSKHTTNFCQDTLLKWVAQTWVQALRDLNQHFLPASERYSCLFIQLSTLRCSTIKSRSTMSRCGWSTQGKYDYNAVGLKANMEMAIEYRFKTPRKY